MLNKNTIKAEVKNQFKDVKITLVEHKKFGIFLVKVLSNKNKVGLIFGETDFDKSENGVVLDKKITW